LLTRVVRPDESLVSQRCQPLNIGSKHGLMECCFRGAHFLFTVFCAAWNSGRLPRYDLPLAISFDERAGVEEVGDL
jgi:hypothetical protein